MEYKPTISPPTVDLKDSQSTDNTPGGRREGKDLIYEAMKMRTGVWPSQGKDLEKVVGGGLLEKQLLNSPVFSRARENADIAIRFESRGTQLKILLYCILIVSNFKYYAEK